ncbi:MAG: sigma 54-interacting transcriptional regulator [Pyrinomonadaceae bacterium]|nr:sigma 54-interacting transcriptional regulator [Pyrinomonadaceae bacterium]
MECSSLFASIDDASFKGRYHHQLALVLRKLGTSTGRADYYDQALVEYSAASYYWEQSDSPRYCAGVQNNIGFLLFKLNRFAEAHEHLDRARALFVRLRDDVHTAQVDEVRARVMLAEERYNDALKVIKPAVRTLERGGEQSLLAEAMETCAVVLARLGRGHESRETFEKAIAAAEIAGDSEGAGRIAISLIEEFRDAFSDVELRQIYARADRLVGASQHQETLQRLRCCAGMLAVIGTSTKGVAVPPPASRQKPIAPLTDDLIDLARQMANSTSCILITGESGTGKEGLARLIHEWSGRSGEFVVVDCLGISDATAESTIFGHMRVAFGGADYDSPGAARTAHGGTLYLDNVNALSLANQAKLFRLVDSGELHVPGAGLPEQVSVRVIASTTVMLEEMVSKGLFRDSLFYRLGVLRIDVPPLRERPDDVAWLVHSFIIERGAADGDATFSDESIEALKRLPLFGNSRELTALITRLAMKCRGKTVTARHVESAAAELATLAPEIQSWKQCDLTEEVRKLERRHIEGALKMSRGRISKAAQLLGLKHHQSLMTMINSRHKDLLAARVPAKKRHKSIIRRRLTLVNGKR